jgi:hypothetical protein
VPYSYQQAKVYPGSAWVEAVADETWSNPAIIYYPGRARKSLTCSTASDRL